MDFSLSELNPLCQLNFPLSREEWHLAHIPEIYLNDVPIARERPFLVGHENLFPRQGGTIIPFISKDLQFRQWPPLR